MLPTKPASSRPQGETRTHRRHGCARTWHTSAALPAGINPRKISKDEGRSSGINLSNNVHGWGKLNYSCMFAAIPCMYTHSPHTVSSSNRHIQSRSRRKELSKVEFQAWLSHTWRLLGLAAGNSQYWQQKSIPMVLHLRAGLKCNRLLIDRLIDYRLLVSNVLLLITFEWLWRWMCREDLQHLLHVWWMASRWKNDQWSMIS